MAKVFLTTTFSPSMMGKITKNVMVEEVDEEEFWWQFDRIINTNKMKFIPAIGHENTAGMVKRRMPEELQEQILCSLHNRINIEVEHGDWIFAIIPQVRFNSTREFTEEEIRNAKFRFFIIL